MEGNVELHAAFNSNYCRQISRRSYGSHLLDLLQCIRFYNVTGAARDSFGGDAFSECRCGYLESSFALREKRESRDIVRWEKLFPILTQQSLPICFEYFYFPSLSGARSRSGTESAQLRGVPHSEGPL
jgi:hypothetical protein